MFDGHADHFVACAVRTVPGTVFGGKDIAFIFRRELIAFVKRDSERSIVRLQEHIGNDHFIFQFGMLAFVPRVLIAAGVIPGPAIKAAFLHVSDVVGRHIVAEGVAFVGGAPEIARFRLNRFANAVADAGGVDAHTGAVGIELQHVGAAHFGGIVIGVIHVRTRADGDQHLFAVAREDDVARPMTAAKRV